MDLVVVDEGIVNGRYLVVAMAQGEVVTSDTLPATSDV